MRQPRKTLYSALVDFLGARKQPLSARLHRFVGFSFPVVTMPLTVWFLFVNRNLRPEYELGWWRLHRLAYRLYRNTTRVPTGTSYRVYLAILAKLAEIPSDVDGVVVECGSFLGGSTANLSLVCDVVGRELVVYDSFEGLPRSSPKDKIESKPGVLRGSLEEVRDNVERHGVPARTRYRKGWFADTLPSHEQPIVLCFLDVDLQESLHECIVNLWPHLTEQGYVFTDDYTILDLCALFYSEEFWQREFERHPPGLIGAGSGIAMGQYWVGPFVRMGGNPAYPLQSPSSTAYTRKDFSAHWGFEPERPNQDRREER